jgi:hypothetical protein
MAGVTVAVTVVVMVVATVGAGTAVAWEIGALVIGTAQVVTHTTSLRRMHASSATCPSPRAWKATTLRLGATVGVLTTAGQATGTAVLAQHTTSLRAIRASSAARQRVSSLLLKAPFRLQVAWPLARTKAWRPLTVSRPQRWGHSELVDTGEGTSLLPRP